MSGTVSKPSKDSFVNAPRVLITGGANGLGSHIAHAFLKEGYRVAVLDINRPALDKFKTLLSTHTKGQPLVDVDNQMLFLECDISKEEQVKDAIYEIEQHWGGLDVLINNGALPHQHGINRQKKSKVEDWTTWEFQKYLDVNVTGTFIVSREAARLLEASKGNMILMGSIRAGVADEYQEAYGASKGGTVSLSRSLAASLGPRGIRVNCISPGWIDVRDAQMELIQEFPGQVEDIWTKAQHQEMWTGHIGRGADVANLCVFLADNTKSAFIHGANIAIDGGASAKLAING